MGLAFSSQVFLGIWLLLSLYVGQKLIRFDGSAAKFVQKQWLWTFLWVFWAIITIGRVLHMEADVEGVDLVNGLDFDTMLIAFAVGLGAFLVYITITGSRSIRNYLLTRVALTLPTIWILVTIVFLTMRAIPGDPILGNVKPGSLTEDQIAQIRAEYDLDQPIYIQYIRYLGDVATLDFGNTINFQGSGNDMNDIIAGRLPATIELVLPAVLIMIAAGIYTGAFAAHNHRRSPDYSLRVASVFLYSIPIFWMGLLLQSIFALELGLLPVSTRFTGLPPFEINTGFYLLDAILANDAASTGRVMEHMILPTLTLAIALIGVFIRLTRSNMIEVLQEDFVTASRARGVPENRVVYRHALRNTFIPIMTFIGLQIAVLMGGAILTETVFSWQGMGLLIRQGIAERDYIVVQSSVTVFAVIVGVISTLTDILYAFIDPRIRY